MSTSAPQSGGREEDRAQDGLVALLAMMRFALVDDLYREDEYGSHILVGLERARRFNLCLGQTLRPYVGDRVLEIGAGIETLTSQFIPRELYIASDINPYYFQYLRSYSFGKPYLRVLEIDADSPTHFRGFRKAIRHSTLDQRGGASTGRAIRVA